MLRKGKTNKLGALKLAVLAVALFAMVALCLTSCGNAAPQSVEYVTGSLKDAEYALGEAFDPTGAIIKVTYDNGKTEEITVTSDMVGLVVFTEAGDAVEVPVVYSSNGVSKTAIITVKVTDPYAAEKAAAVQTMSAAMTANSTDKAVAALITSYANDIKKATSKESIDLLLADFQADLTEIVDGKDAIIKAINAIDYTVLYEQYSKLVDAQLQITVTAVKAADSLAAAQALQLDFVNFVNLQIATQNVYLGTTGLNERKMELIKKVEACELKADDLLTNLDPANLGTIASMTFMDKVDAAKVTMEDFKTRIILALNLDELLTEFEEDILPGVKTPFDEIYELVKNGHVVNAAALKQDETTGAWAPATGDEELDATGILLGKLVTLRTDAATIFTDAYYDANMDAYKYTDAEGNDQVVNLDTIYTDINTKYVALTAVQTAAAADVNTKIDTLLAMIEAGTATKADIDTAIADAWTALKTWGAANAIFSEDAAITIFNNLVFDKKYTGAFTFPTTWADYDITQDYMIAYYVPNFIPLVNASILADYEKVELAVDAIRPIIYTTDLAVDANQSIVDAQAAIDAFKANHAEAAANEYAERLAAEQVTVDTARTAYDKRVADAEAIIDMVDALPATIEIEHYASAEGVLKLAYDAYLAFAAENTLNGTIYTDVITNEADLIADMDVYAQKAYADAQVMGTATIYAAFKTALATTDAASETVLREQMKNETQNLTAALNAIPYDATGKTNFNIIEILNTNIANIDSTAETSAAAIIAMGH